MRTLCLIAAVLMVSGCFGSRIDREEDLWPYFDLARTRGLAAPKIRQMTEIEKTQLPKAALERLIASVQPAPRNGHHYLFAVGIEDYLYLPDIANTEASLQAVASALGVTLGITARNRVVISGARATTGYISSELDALLARLGPQDTLYFYFAGHSLPDTDSKDTVHLLARDAQVKAYASASLPMTEVIETMDRSNVGRIWAFMDTSFSGKASQSAHLLGDIAGVGVGPEHESLPAKISVFHAAGADQYANGYRERGHRLFSYYLAEGLALGITDASSLNDHIGEAVTRTSRRMGRGFVQTPTLQGTPGDISR